MNERRKSQIIDDCLNALNTGSLSESECIERYPDLEQDLKYAISINQQFNSKSLPGLNVGKSRLIKQNILFNLQDRSGSVTKSSTFRYRWQKTKRRFAMTWFIIVTTVLSLLSGAGAVYASNEALPGEFLYPVKTWVEDVQLALSPDSVDANLTGIFSSRRIEELLELIEEGSFDNMDELLGGYQNRTELMTQAMEKVEAKNPEEAIRLRTELEAKLREQARQIETLLEGGVDGDDLPLQVRLRLMLQTNTQTRLRINEEDDGIVDDPLEPSIEDSGSEVPVEEDAGDNQEQNKVQNQNRNQVEYTSDELFKNGALYFQFKFADSLAGDVYAEVEGAKYKCSVDSSLVTCDLTGSAGRGKLKLYDMKTHELLYSYDYEHNYAYLWEGKKSGGNENQERGDSDNGESGHDSGRTGGNK